MLVVEHLVKTFTGDKARRRIGGASAGAPGRIHAVDDVSVEVREGEMFTLLGPSGCGKTTTLRSVAGLERPDSGVIRVAGQLMFSGGAGRSVQVPVNRRGLGMVFQSYAIWPHMKVFDNVAFPLQVLPRSTRPSRKVIRERVMSVLETMELDQLAARQATKLSGGQQQRLALARALVTEPSLLLLDEPLSNLDAKLRESLRFELKRLQREIGITSVYVTHDQIEALALSSRIAVMCDGKIMQTGTPREIYQKPNSKFVAEFIGTSNFISGTVGSKRNGVLVVDTDEGRLHIEGQLAGAAGATVVIAVRPEGIRLSTEPVAGPVPNAWTGEVITRSFLGDSIDHIVRVGTLQLRSRSNPGTSLPPGTRVTVHISPTSPTLIPTSSSP